MSFAQKPVVEKAEVIQLLITTTILLIDYYCFEYLAYFQLLQNNSSN